MPGREDDDDGPLSPRALRATAKDWDDPETDDDGQKATKVVDARQLLAQLKKLAERDPDDEETQPKSRLARAALRALEKKSKPKSSALDATFRGLTQKRSQRTVKFLLKINIFVKNRLQFKRN